MQPRIKLAALAQQGSSVRWGPAGQCSLVLNDKAHALHRLTRTSWPRWHKLAHTAAYSTHQSCSERVVSSQAPTRHQISALPSRFCKM